MISPLFSVPLDNYAIVLSLRFYPNFSETSQYKIPSAWLCSGWNFLLLHLQQCLLSAYLPVRNISFSL